MANFKLPTFDSSFPDISHNAVAGAVHFVVLDHATVMPIPMPLTAEELWQTPGSTSMEGDEGATERDKLFLYKRAMDETRSPKYEQQGQLGKTWVGFLAGEDASKKKIPKRRAVVLSELERKTKKGNAALSYLHLGSQIYTILGLGILPGAAIAEGHSISSSGINEVSGSNLWLSNSVHSPNAFSPVELQNILLPLKFSSTTSSPGGGLNGQIAPLPQNNPIPGASTSQIPLPKGSEGPLGLGPGTTGPSEEGVISGGTGGGTSIAPSLYLGGPPSTVSYVQHGSAKTVDSNLFVASTGSGSGTLTGATIQITGGYTPGQDVLTLTGTLPAGVTSSFDPTTGTLTLTGTAPLSDYVTLLESVTYQDTASTPAVQDRLVTFTVDDGTLSASKTAIVTVTDLPILANPGTVAYYEGETPSSTPSAPAVSAGLSVSELSGASLTGATVVITNTQAGDQLYVDPNLLTANGLTAAYSTVGGQETLTLSGPASAGVYQTVLEQVEYYSTDAAGTNLGGTRDVTYTVTDSNNLTSNPVTGLVNPVSGPVLANPGTVVYYEGETPSSAPSAPAVSAGLSVSDLSGASLTGATVMITNTQAGDQLYVDPNLLTANGLTGAYSTVGGQETLTLSGPASTAVYQTVLEHVEYYSTDAAGTNVGSTRDVTYTVTDSNNLTSNPVTGLVNPVSGPVLANSGTVTYLQGESLTSTPSAPDVSAALSVSDLSTTTLTSATISINNASFQVGDTLSVPTADLQGGITQSYDPSTGILTLSGATSLANYSLALDNVIYSSTNPDLSTTVRSVTYTVTDNNGLTSNAVTGQVDILDNISVSNANNLNYIQSEGATAISPGLIVVEPASLPLLPVTLTSASVQITGNYQSGEDVLSFSGTLPGGVTDSFNAATGTFTFTGNAPLISYTNLLQGVSYQDTAATPDAVVRTVTYTANNGSLSDSTTGTINITDAPVITGLANLNYTQGESPIALSPNVLVTEASSLAPVLTSASVQITGNYQSGEDVLSFTGTLLGGVSGSFDASTGTFTFTGTASVGTYTQLLAQVDYNDTASIPDAVTRTVTYTVNDGSLNASSTELLSVTDAPPTLSGGGILNYDQGQAASVISTNLIISEVSSGTPMLTNAAVQITGNFQSGDQLSVLNLPSDIQSSYNSATGILTLSGTAPVTDYQTALDSVAYNSTATTPSILPRTVTYTAGDGGTLGSTTGTINVTDDPTVSNASTLDYTQGTSPQAISPGIIVGDPSSTQLTNASVQITNFQSGDQLTVLNLPSDIMASYNATNGLLTLTGTAFLSDYQTALGSVAYSTSSSSLLPRGITYTVTDNTLSGSTQGIVDVLTPTAPVLTGAATAIYVENGSFVQNGPSQAVNPTLAITDADSSTITHAFVSIASNYTDGQDVLGVNSSFLPGGVTDSFNASTGILTITGNATLAQYQTILENVTYTGDAFATPDTQVRTIDYVVQDALSTNSNILGTALTLEYPPVLAITSLFSDWNKNTFYTGNTSQNSSPHDPKLVFMNILTDLDPNNLAGGNINITYVSGSVSTDQLSILPVGNVTLSGNQVYDSGILVGTVSGGSNGSSFSISLASGATPGTVTDVINSIAYQTSTTTPTPGLEKVLNMVVTDVNGLTATENVTVKLDYTPQISGVNNLNYSDDASPVQVAPSVTLADPGDTTFVSAMVQLGTNGTTYVQGQDLLTFTPIGGNPITGSFNASTGILTLSGTATIAQYQAALASVYYSNTSTSTSNVSLSFDVSVSNGVNAAAEQATITEIPQSPALATTNTLNYIQNEVSLAAIDPGITVSDPSAITLTNASVAITSNFQVGDTLNASNLLGGITESYNPSTGVLTLSGTASLSNYQAALESVDYNSTAVTPSVSARAVTYTVFDNTLSASSVSTINLTDSPVVNPGSNSTLSYFAGQPATVVDSGLAVTESATNSGLQVLTSATVSIGNFQLGDVLSITAPSGMNETYNLSTGVLTLTSTTPLAVSSYQTVLDSLEYNSNLSNPSVIPRTLTYTVTDVVPGSGTLTGTGQTTVDLTAGLAVNNAGNINYNKGNPAVDMSPSLSVTESASTPALDILTSASVAITGNYAGSQDVLAVSNSVLTANGLTSSDVTFSNGVLTITGAATVAQYQNVLRAVTYQDTSSTPTVDTRTMTYTVNDGPLTASTTGSVNVGNPPVVTLVTANLSYAAVQGAVAESPSVTITDPATSTLTGATVQITTNYAGSQDVLAVPNSVLTANGLTPSDVTINGGLLTITGNATVAQYQNVLRAVTFSDGSAHPSTTTQTIVYSVTDSLNQSASDSGGIVVQQPGISFSGNVMGGGGYTQTNSPYSVGVQSIGIVDTYTSTLQTITFSISSGFTVGDVLSIPSTDLPLGTTESYNAATGVLTLTGPTPDSSYFYNGPSNVLGDLQFSTGIESDTTTSRNISLQASDGTFTSTNLLFWSNLAVFPISDQPTLANSDTLNYNGNDFINNQAVPVTPGLTLAENYSSTVNMTSATVTINGYQSGQDVLSVSSSLLTNNGGLTASFNTSTGVLTISGSATAAQYQNVLEGVSYTNTDSANTANTTTRSVSYVVTASGAHTPTSNTLTSTLEFIGPVLSGLNTTTGYTVPAGLSTVVAGTGAVTELNTTGSFFNIGGNITVAYGSGATQYDQLTITAGGQVTVSGSTVSVNNQAVGTISGGSNGTPLVFTITQSITPTFEVQDILDRVSYSNNAPVTPNAQRVLDVTLNDGSGNTSNMETVTVNTKYNYYVQINGLSDPVGTANTMGTSTGGNFNMNGNGFGDLVIGAPTSTTTSGGTHTNAGAIFVYLGSATEGTPTTAISLPSTNQGVEFYLPTTGALLGTSVAGVSNFDNSGYGSILASAPGINTTYLIYGNFSTGNPSTPYNLSTYAADTKITDSISTNLGIAVGSVDNFNGNGLSDLLISDNTNTYVIFGTGATLGATFAVSSLNGANGFEVLNATNGAAGSMQLNSVGDFVGNGFSDFIIGSPGAVTDGRATVIFGSSSAFAATIDANTLTGSNGFTFNGTAAVNDVGSSVTGIGDFTGAGHNDIAIASGTNGLAYVITGQTTIQGSYSPTDIGGALQGFTIQAPAGDTIFSVASAGDFTGDGYSDLLVGVQNGTTLTAYLIYGTNTIANGSTLSLSSFNSSEGLMFTTVANNASSIPGNAILQGVGDVTGNGFSDFVFGVPNPSTGSSGVQLFYGYNPNLTLQGTSGTLTGTNNVNNVIELTGNGTIIGGGGTATNTLIAGHGNATITAGPNNDTIIAGNGTDIINLGAGNDKAWVDGNATFNYALGDGNDQIHGATGQGWTDVINLSGVASSPSATLGGVGSWVLTVEGHVVNNLPATATSDTLSGPLSGTVTLHSTSGVETIQFDHIEKLQW